MPDQLPPDLVRYLAASTDLPPATAVRVIADVVAYFSETIEEFVILLPQTREYDALTVAERLRGHIAAMAIPVDDSDPAGPTVTLTISVGVAALDGERRELTDMLAAADSALYYAKETGRNKTHVITATRQAS